MIDRIPPHNAEAERSVLGAAMLDKDILSEILEEVKEEDFYNENHKEIFRAIWDLYRENSPVDVLTVCEELKRILQPSQPMFHRRQTAPNMRRSSQKKPPSGR